MSEGSGNLGMCCWCGVGPACDVLQLLVHGRLGWHCQLVEAGHGSCSRTLTTACHRSKIRSKCQ